MNFVISTNLGANNTKLNIYIYIYIYKIENLFETESNPKGYFAICKSIHIYTKGVKIDKRLF